MEETTEISVTKSGGNIFEDLGFENPEEELLRADLTIAIYNALTAQRLTARKLAKLTGIESADATRLASCRSTDLSTERLESIVRILEQDTQTDADSVVQAVPTHQ